MTNFIRKNRFAFALILIAVCMIAFGVWKEETAVVLRKAVNICMECIGLG